MLDASPATSLLDPETCGEDHAFNLLQATTLAPRLCNGCADYHATVPINRITGHSGWKNGARQALGGALVPLLQAAAEAQHPIDVVITGAGDTSVLATAAHTAAKLGTACLHSTRFTVLDRCETPLQLCRAFGARHGLNVATLAVDLAGPGPSLAADIVIAHSFLLFLPPEAHIPALRRWASWLKPGGRIVIWNSVNRTSATSQREEIRASMRALIDAGQYKVGEPVADFFARLSRYTAVTRVGERGFARASAVRDLAAAADLVETSYAEFDRNCRLDDGSVFVQQNALAVLAAH